MSFTKNVLASFRDNPAKAAEYVTENKLIFLALHAAGVKSLRVESDGSRISFIYLESEASVIANEVMKALTNGSVENDNDDTYRVNISRLIIGWNVWETFLNQMRDANKQGRKSSYRSE